MAIGGTGGCTEEEDFKSKDEEQAGCGLEAGGAAAQHLPPVPSGQAPSCGLSSLRLVSRTPGHRGQLGGGEPVWL